jgi:hypothetical protein
MDGLVRIKPIASRALRLFAVLVVLSASAYALVRWHHARMARSCTAFAHDVDDPLTCASRLWLFGTSWEGLVVRWLLLLAFCMFVSWGWSLVLRKRR